jgi:hypothetical protein
VSSGFFPPLTPRPAVAGLYAPADQARRLPSIFGGVGVGWLGSLAGFLADLGRIPVPYTLEIRQGETLVGAVLTKHVPRTRGLKLIPLQRRSDDIAVFVLPNMFPAHGD